MKLSVEDNMKLEKLTFPDLHPQLQIWCSSIHQRAAQTLIFGKIIYCFAFSLVNLTGLIATQILALSGCSSF